MNCDKIHPVSSGLEAANSSRNNNNSLGGAHGLETNHHQVEAPNHSNSLSNNHHYYQTISHRALPALPESTSLLPPFKNIKQQSPAAGSIQFNHTNSNHSSNVISNSSTSASSSTSSSSGGQISNDEKDHKAKKIESASSAMDRLRDCGWYWGPLSKEGAAKLLESEPNGSFLVRDSSDENYIFSLTYKKNDEINHTRIEHSQGNFSFGGTKQKFSSNTIVDFIENFIEHSQSGRYLFFRHRDPSRQGPVRLQLTNPVSRFKEIRSLKHMTR